MEDRFFAAVMIMSERKNVCIYIYSIFVSTVLDWIDLYRSCWKLREIEGYVASPQMIASFHLAICMYTFF